MEAMKNIDYSEIVDELVGKEKEVIKGALIGYSTEDLHAIYKKASDVQRAMGGIGEFAIVNPGEYEAIKEACSEMMHEKKEEGK